VSVTVVPRPYFRGHETLLPLLRGKGINRRDRTIVFLALERDEFGRKFLIIDTYQPSIRDSFDEKDIELD
jgi:hypothetical protein